MPFNHPHCEGKHDTVAEARECEGIEQKLPPANLTEGQQKYLSDLLAGYYAKLAGDETPATISYQAGKLIMDKLIDARRLKATGKPYSLPPNILIAHSPKAGQPKTRTPTGRKSK